MGNLEDQPWDPMLGETVDQPNRRPPLSQGRGHRYQFQSGDKPLRGFTIKRAIGYGGFGEVYFALSNAGKKVALKLLTHHENLEERGVTSCMNLKWPNLIEVYDLVTSDDGDKFVVMEYVEGHNLADILVKNPEGLGDEQILHLMTGLISGVEYLHSCGIVHRDLKPANIFVEDGVVKIGDYGLSKAIGASSHGMHTKEIGTVHYMAPEISKSNYDKTIDIYAVGIILYELVTGQVPFLGQSRSEVLMKHLTSLPDLQGIRYPYLPVIKKALQKDPRFRYQNVAEILPDLQGPPPEIVFEDGTHSGQNRQEPELIIDDEPPSPKEVVAQWREQKRQQQGGGSRRLPLRPITRQRGWFGFGPRSTGAERSAQPPRPPLPEPPAEPGTREQIAEWTSGMALAAPLVIFGGFPLASLAVGLQPGQLLRQAPTELGYFITITLLGVWLALLSGRLAMVRVNSDLNRRLLGLAIGAGFGLLASVLASWFCLPAWRGHSQVLVDLAPGLVNQTTLLGSMACATYFGIIFASTNWSKLVRRGRPSRFRFLPVALVFAISAVAANVFEFPSALGILSSILIATVVQLVSPWSREAADYEKSVIQRLKMA